MTHYLLDTNVVSALRVPLRNPAVAAWVRPIPLTALHISVFTVLEIEHGVRAKERKDPTQGAVLRRWLEGSLLPSFTGRILDFDLAAARKLACYRVPDHAPFTDALIAATADVAGMTVATRNIRHFLPLNVPCLNPWDSGKHPPSGLSQC
ncbi:MAG: type II toxin-antitoxin system VapC family toxin [Propionibacteriaceae bacterium]|nr:type II toxin-antitoxin system VapC family toxin [Propionibacteriaceae bacterium]